MSQVRNSLDLPGGVKDDARELIAFITELLQFECVQTSAYGADLKAAQTQLQGCLSTQETMVDGLELNEVFLSVSKRVGAMPADLRQLLTTPWLNLF
jgi:hypothetical protein